MEENENNSQTLIDICEKIKRDFKNNLILNIQFYTVSLLLENIALRLYLNKDKESDLINDEMRERLISYGEFSRELSEKGKSYPTLINEKAFVNAYQDFEDYLGKIFTMLYNAFPKFMTFKTKDNMIQIDINDVYESTDNEDLKLKIIQKKVKNSIQNNNIIEVLNRFKNIFSINIDFDQDDLKLLFVMSKNRNMIIHNNGIINYSYIMDLKKMGIKTQYSINQSLASDIAKIAGTCRNLTDRFVESINDKIVSEINNLRAYYMKELHN